MTEFNKQLEAALQKEVERRSNLIKTDSVITNHPRRGSCSSFKSMKSMEEQTAKMPYTPMKNQHKSEHEIR